jgi:hypothetical protein
MGGRWKRDDPGRKYGVRGGKRFAGARCEWAADERRDIWKLEMRDANGKFIWKLMSLSIGYTAPHTLLYNTLRLKLSSVLAGIIMPIV